MKKLNIENSQLDAIGKQLIRSKMTASADIDAIVSNPLLFSAVAKKITDNKKPRLAKPSGFWLMGRFAAATAGSALLILLTVGIIDFLRSDNLPVMSDVSQVSDAGPENARPVFPPRGTIDGKLSAGRAVKAEYRAEKIRPARRAKAVRIPVVSIEAEGEFYPIAYTGDLSETAGGGRIIRVDLKRSSLFALGVNLPLENYDETIKTDLLVGADGVARGVRVVN